MFSGQNQSSINFRRSLNSWFGFVAWSKIYLHQFQSPTLTKQTHWNILMVHEKKKPHLCSICCSTFGAKDILKKHIETIHEGKKSYNWLLCKARFKSRCKKETYLLDIDTCSICKSSFGISQYLKTHISVVHEKKNLTCAQFALVLLVKNILIQFINQKYHENAYFAKQNSKIGEKRKHFVWFGRKNFTVKLSIFLLFMKLLSLVYVLFVNADLLQRKLWENILKQLIV